MKQNGVVLFCALTIVPAISTFNVIYPICPQVCLCSFEFTDCKFSRLIHLPSGLDPNITSLDLAYNIFLEFPDELNQYHNLKQLNLSHNKIQSLGAGAFRNLLNLERLDLTYNSFIDWLDIRSNAFSGAGSLVFLDLSHNLLRSFPQNKNPLQIPSLQILRLSNCSIDNVDNKIMESLPNLIELHLSENPIKQIRTGFSSETLRYLDLSRCNLHYVYPGAFTNLTELDTLHMNQNIYLKKFTCTSSRLLFLDLADCNLETIPNGFLPRVYEANFYGNHFRIIPNSSFVNFPNLTILDLSYNAISVIENRAFEHLDRVERIDLSQNTLSVVNSDLFSTNHRLKYLNLSRNYFNTIQNFQNPTLEVLDLSSCEIKVFSKNALENMANLQILNLSKNVISLLPDNFQGRNLVSLDVSLCRIKSINNKTLSEMPSLRELNLAGNRLTAASPDSLAQIISLDISDNPWRCDCGQLKDLYVWLTKTGKRIDNLYCQSPEVFEGHSWLSACQKEWHPELTRGTTVWWYSTGLVIAVFLVLFIILAMRRMYMLKEKRIREANDARRAEEREVLQRMRRRQLEAREEASRNAPDPRELQTPPSYNEALLLPRLDSSHPSLSGSLHSLASKHSIHGSLTDVATNKRSRPRRKRRRRKSDSSEGQRASRVVLESDSPNSEPDRPQPRTTLESDF